MQAVNSPEKKGITGSRIRGEVLGILKKGWTGVYMSDVSNGAMAARGAAVHAGQGGLWGLF